MCSSAEQHLVEPLRMGPPAAGDGVIRRTELCERYNRFEKGVAVPIRVDDPGLSLSQNEGKTPGAHLLLGVATDALTFHPASVVSTDALGRNQQIVIPFNMPVKLVVNSAFFKLT